MYMTMKMYYDYRIELNKFQNSIWYWANFLSLEESVDL